MKVLIDTRIINFHRFNNIQNLLIPAITDIKKACGVMACTLQECMNRNKLFAKNNVKNIEEYNETVQSKLPRIIVFLEDLCDLMDYEKEDVEESLIEIAKISRKVGIHLIISTYRTSTEIITGRIKANIPTRLTFKLPSRVDFRTVIDKSGAEKLLPYGDALFIKVEEREQRRIQAPYISDEEIEKIIDEIKVEEKSNSSDEIMKIIDKKTMKSDDTDYEVDPLLNDAIDEVISTGMVSIPFIQQRFKIGYARAGRIVDQMEERGIISGDNADKTRKVLINKDFGEAQTNVQEQSENEEKEQVGAENTKYGDEYGNKSSIFRKWWFWILVGMFLYEVFK